MSGIVFHPLEGRLWSDERGWGVKPLEAAGLAGVPLGDLHVVSLEPGKERGNHRHDGTEWLLVAGGGVEVRWRLSDEGMVSRRMLEGRGPVLLEIPPGAAHAVRNVGEGTVHLVAFSGRAPMATAPSPLE